MPQPAYKYIIDLPYCPFAGQSEPTDQEISALFDPWQSLFGTGAYRKVVEDAYKWVHHLPRENKVPLTAVIVPTMNSYYYIAVPQRAPSSSPPVYPFYFKYYGNNAAQDPTSPPSSVLGGSTQEGQCEKITYTPIGPHGNKPT